MGSVTSNPNTTVSLLPAAVVDAYEDRRDVIFGQVPSAATGASAAGKLTSDVHLKTTAEIKVLFGATSYLTNQILDWKAANGGFSPLDVVSITEGSGTPADAAITVTGTAASADASIKVCVFDEEKYSVTVAVTSTDTVAEIATAIYDAFVVLEAATDVPFVTTNTPAGTVVFTAVDDGTIGNNYPIRIEGDIAGVTLPITAFANGATDPVITSILTPITGIRYTGLLWADNWAITDIDTEMDSRFNASNAVMDGVVFQGQIGTYSAVGALPANTNSPSICLLGCEELNVTNESQGPVICRMAGCVAAEFMGVRSKRMTTGAPIASNIISTSGGLDAFGGPSLASLPYFNTPLSDTPVTPSTNLWTSAEQAALADLGVTTYGVNSAQNAMIMAQAVTTYTTDAGGNPNVSFHYLNYVDTGSVCREIFYSTLKSTFAQSRLTEGDLIAGRSMANAESIKAELLKIYRILEGLALTQAGSTAEAYFSTNTTVTVSLADRSVTISGPLPIVTQLGTINYSLQMSFTITGTGTQITV